MYFAIKITNSDCNPAGSTSTESFANSNGNFSFKNDSSSSTESSELETGVYWIHQHIFCYFFKNNSWKFKISLQFSDQMELCILSLISENCFPCQWNVMSLGIPVRQ